MLFHVDLVCSNLIMLIDRSLLTLLPHFHLSMYLDYMSLLHTLVISYLSLLPLLSSLSLYFIIHLHYNPLPPSHIQLLLHILHSHLFILCLVYNYFHYLLHSSMLYLHYYIHFLMHSSSLLHYFLSNHLVLHLHLYLVQHYHTPMLIHYSLHYHFMLDLLPYLILSSLYLFRFHLCYSLLSIRILYLLLSQNLRYFHLLSLNHYFLLMLLLH